MKFTCEEISNCFAKLFPPLFLTIIVVGAFCILGFGNPDTELSKQLNAIILDCFGGALLWMKMKNE
jgi:hypothetical protein